MSETDQKISEAVEEKAQEIAAEKTEIAAAVIETAQERVENAEAVAQVIADATVMTELGRRIESCERICTTWQGEMDAMKSQVSILQGSLADLSAKLPPNLIAPVVETAQQDRKGSPIPPVSDKTELVLATNPDDAGGQGDQKTPPAKKKRFAL